MDLNNVIDNFLKESGYQFHNRFASALGNFNDCYVKRGGLDDNYSVIVITFRVADDGILMVNKITRSVARSSKPDKRWLEINIVEPDSIEVLARFIGTDII